MQSLERIKVINFFLVLIVPLGVLPLQLVFLLWLLHLLTEQLCEAHGRHLDIQIVHFAKQHSQVELSRIEGLRTELLGVALLLPLNEIIEVNEVVVVQVVNHLYDLRVRLRVKVR